MHLINTVASSLFADAFTHWWVHLFVYGCIHCSQVRNGNNRFGFIKHWVRWSINQNPTNLFGWKVWEGISRLHSFIPKRMSGLSFPYCHISSSRVMRSTFLYNQFLHLWKWIWSFLQTCWGYLPALQNAISQSICKTWLAVGTQIFIENISPLVISDHNHSPSIIAWMFVVIEAMHKTDQDSFGKEPQNHGHLPELT